MADFTALVNRRDNLFTLVYYTRVWPDQGADFINQKFIQQKSWLKYDIGATLTAGIIGGSPLKFAAFGSSVHGNCS